MEDNTSVPIVITKLFATQVDRCFETNTYGEGVRIYINSKVNWIIAKGIIYTYC